jgi:hypothetical protein
MAKPKKILGAIEKINIEGNIYRARIDTGARRSSINESLIKKLKLGTPKGKVRIESANGIKERKLIKIKFKLKNEEFSSLFSVADRSLMRYKILIGRDILKNKFLVDVSK